MMAVDSLHAAVPLVVPSGVSACCSSACRRACSARAFAPPSAQPSDVQASCLERARPAAPGLSICAFAGGLAAGAAEPPGRRCPERERGAKAEAKDAAPGRIESQSAHGVARRTQLRRRAARGPRQCRHVRVLRTTGHARACRERSHDRPPRRRFPHPPQRPEEPGPELRFKVLKQAGKASSGKSSVRRPGAASGSGRAAGSGPARAWGAATARFAGAKLTPMSRRVTIKTLLVNQRGQPAVARQAPALHRARWRGPRRRAGPSLRAADRCRRPRRLQGTLRRRPAPFPLHPLARGWRGTRRPAHLHAAPHGSHGGRPARALIG